VLDERWDYGGPGDDPDPTEPKRADWGMLEGRLVAIDYCAPAIDDGEGEPDTD
jgi:hypothetical protein